MRAHFARLAGRRSVNCVPSFSIYIFRGVFVPREPPLSLYICAPKSAAGTRTVAARSRWTTRQWPPIGNNSLNYAFSVINLFLRSRTSGGRARALSGFVCFAIEHICDVVDGCVWLRTNIYIYMAAELCPR